MINIDKVETNAHDNDTVEATKLRWYSVSELEKIFRDHMEFLQNNNKLIYDDETKVKDTDILYIDFKNADLSEMNKVSIKDEKDGSLLQILSYVTFTNCYLGKLNSFLAATATYSDPRDYNKPFHRIDHCNFKNCHIDSSAGLYITDITFVECCFCGMRSNMLKETSFSNCKFIDCAFDSYMADAYFIDSIIRQCTFDSDSRNKKQCTFNRCFIINSKMVIDHINIYYSANDGIGFMSFKEMNLVYSSFYDIQFIHRTDGDETDKKLSESRIFRSSFSNCTSSHGVIMQINTSNLNNINIGFITIITNRPEDNVLIFADTVRGDDWECHGMTFKEFCEKVKELKAINLQRLIDIIYGTIHSRFILEEKNEK